MNHITGHITSITFNIRRVVRIREISSAILNDITSSPHIYESIESYKNVEWNAFDLLASSLVDYFLAPLRIRPSTCVQMTKFELRNPQLKIYYHSLCPLKLPLLCIQLYCRWRASSICGFWEHSKRISQMRQCDDEHLPVTEAYTTLM